VTNRGSSIWLTALKKLQQKAEEAGVDMNDAAQVRLFLILKGLY
jgi:hypothetical protein